MQYLASVTDISRTGEFPHPPAQYWTHTSSSLPVFSCISTHWFTQKGNHQETNLLTESWLKFLWNLGVKDFSRWKLHRLIYIPHYEQCPLFFVLKVENITIELTIYIYTHTLHAKYCTFPFPLYLILLPETVHRLLYSCETLFSANVDDFKRTRIRFEAVFRRGGRSRDFIFVFQQGFLWHCHSTLKTLLHFFMYSRWNGHFMSFLCRDRHFLQVILIHDNWLLKHSKARHGL